MSAPEAPSILIVEDEPGLREGLVGAIETLGYRAIPAPGLGEARRVFAAGAPEDVARDPQRDRAMAGRAPGFRPFPKTC